MEDVDVFANVDLMAGITTTLITHYKIRFFCEQVNNATLAFISPLPSNQDRIHKQKSKKKPKLSMPFGTGNFGIEITVRK